MRKGESIRPNLETYSYMIGSHKTKMHALYVSNLSIEAYKKAKLNNKVDEMKSLIKHDDYLPNIEEIGAKLMNLGKTGYYQQIENILHTNLQL